MPLSFKTAIVTPLLKKSSLDHDTLSNYCPVSNLPYVSKLFETAVASQIRDYKTQHNLYAQFQSACRSGHSTGTVVLRVQSDILRAIDDRKRVFLVLFDLSVAFATVCHQRLLHWLESRFGVTDGALKWISSYLCGQKKD